MKLSYREKILILVLAVVIVLFGGVRLLVIPAYQDTISQAARLQGLVIQQAAANADIKAAQSINQYISSAGQKAADAAKPFFPALDSDQLQLWITNISVSKSLAIVSVSISDPAVDSLENKAAGAVSSDYPIKNYADEAKGGAAKQKPAQSASGGMKGSDTAVLRSTMTLTMTGSYANLLSWIDAVNGSGRTVKISKINLASKTGGVLSITAVLDCYGVEKINSADSTVSWSLTKPAGKNMM